MVSLEGNSCDSPTLFMEYMELNYKGMDLVLLSYFCLFIVLDIGRTRHRGL